MDRLATVFACESQPIVIEGLRAALEASRELLLVGAADPQHAETMIGELTPDIVLLSPPDDSQALPLLEKLRQASPRSRFVLWVRDPARIDQYRAFRLGMRGLLRKSLPAGVLLDCLTSVARGETWSESPPAAAPQRLALPKLTRREREVVRLLCRGMKNKQIAEALAIAPGTVKVHLMHIFEKTGARSRYELAIGAYRLGLELGEESRTET